MKKYYVLPILLVLAPTLSACQDYEHSIVAINNMGANGLVEISKAALLNLLESKQQFVFEQYSPTCTHCEKLRPLLEKYALNNKKTIYTCNMYGLTEEEFNTDYKAVYPDIFTDYYVPRIQFIKEGKLTYEVNSSKFSTYSGLTNIMNNHFFSSKIYMVQSEEEFTSFTEKNKDYVVYMYDQEDVKSLSFNEIATYCICGAVVISIIAIIIVGMVNDKKKKVVVVNSKIDLKDEDVEENANKEEE